MVATDASLRLTPTVQKAFARARQAELEVVQSDCLASLWNPT